MRTQGALIKWNADRGFGFIKTRDSGIEVYVHITSFTRSTRLPKIGDALSFDIVTIADGRKQAKAVTYDMPLDPAVLSLAPIDRPAGHRAASAMQDRASALRADRSRDRDRDHHRHGRESRDTSTSGLYTAFFGVLLIGGLVFGYRRFLEDRAVAVDTLHGRSAETMIAPTTPAAAAPAYRCDGRTRCSQMRSCQDATTVLQRCPGTEMDGDGDGIPCEQQWCK